MYVTKNSLAASELETNVFDIIGGVGSAIGDWTRKQMGLPTEAEERAAAAKEQIEANKQLGMTSILANAQLQQYAIIGGILVVGLTTYLIITGKKKKGAA